MVLIESEIRVQRHPCGDFHSHLLTSEIFKQISLAFYICEINKNCTLTFPPLMSDWEAQSSLLMCLVICSSSIVAHCCLSLCLTWSCGLEYGFEIWRNSKRKRKNGAIGNKAIRRDPEAMQCFGRITMDIFLCHLSCLAFICTMSIIYQF